MNLQNAELAVLWAVCLISLLLWFALDVDLENALWWAVKTPGPIGAGIGSVRADKVAICLGWSGVVLLAASYRYGLSAKRVLTFLGAALLTLIAVSVLELHALEIPYLYLVYRYPSAALALVVAKIVVSAGFAYRLLTREAFAMRHAAIVAAVAMGACGLMIWNGLFDVFYPGIGWR